MQNSRIFPASLAQPPEVRTSGSFGTSEERLEWVQPRDLWQALLYRCGGTFRLQGTATPFSAFDLIIVPPGSRCSVAFADEGPWVYDFFGFSPVEDTRDLVGLPFLSPLGDEGLFWDLNFRRALSRVQFSRTSIASVAAALLWAVAVPESALQRNPYLEEAERQINADLAGDLRISHLARKLNISQAQLTRIFLAESGRTPHQYVLELRAKRAQDLLAGTTLPIKQVAAQCGFPDPHAFGRFVRARLGASPRAVRAGQQTIDIYRVEEYRRLGMSIALPSQPSGEPSAKG